LGLATGLGWFITKHALGLYGSVPPPGGFRRGDTTAAQAAIDASARPVALTVEHDSPATVTAATVIRGQDGTATGAPLIARLPDGRHMALAAADDAVVAEVGSQDVPGLVGRRVVVQAGEPRYRLAEG
jgi:acetyl-CoA C-acetyltransferase